MESSNPPTPTALSIEYATPEDVAGAGSRALPAILLCTPGLLCWMLLAAGFVGRTVPPFVGRLVDGLFIPLLAAAVLTAILSIIIYLFIQRQRRPWFVILNLVINISGLLFLIGIFMVGAIISSHR